MESILTNVLIIDERIQKYFYATIHPGIKKPVGSIAKKSFIYCPAPHQINLNQQSYDADIRNSVSAYLRKFLNEQKKPKGLDIAVIHLGIA